MKSKYSNTPTIIEGIHFASRKEAARYTDLKLLEKHGHISNLRLQVPYELNEGGTFSYKYLADFVYIEKGNQIIEDVKGKQTSEFKKKSKLMKKVYGINIRLT